MIIAGAILLAVGALLVAGAVRWIRSRAEPTARRMVIESLASHLHCKVELDHLHVTVFPGFPHLLVTGDGLRIESIDGRPHLANSGVPMLTAKSFQFRASFATLLFNQTGVIKVYVQDVIVTVPPASSTAAIPISKAPSIPGSLMLRQIVASGARLILETESPDKPAVEFNFQNIVLDDLGPKQAFAFEGSLINPPPLDVISARGNLGPWNSNAPRETPIDGTFRFVHADLSAIPGLAGIMEGSGNFGGSVAQLTAEGSTDTKGFALATGERPFALRTRFKAALNNGTGDVAVQSNTAEFLGTKIEGSGALTASKAGHTTELDLNIKGHNEDMLILLSKAKPPLLKGVLDFNGHLSLPPGTQSVVTRSHLKGSSIVHNATWGDASLQQQVDEVSQRAIGNAKLAKSSPSLIPDAPSEMITDVAIDRGTMQLTGLVYSMPGAAIVMHGTYPITGTEIDLHGVARTVARASQLTTGWKSLLLKPVDPFLGKHGAGAEIPVKLTGNLAHPLFGTDFKNRGDDKAATEKIPTTLHK